MAKRAPTLLTGDCPYLGKQQAIIAVYQETLQPGTKIPAYQVEEMECDFSEECGISPCPIMKNAPKHPPGIGFA